MPFPGIALSYCGVIRLDAEGGGTWRAYHSRDENVGPHGELTTGLYVSYVKHLTFIPARGRKFLTDSAGGDRLGQSTSDHPHAQTQDIPHGRLRGRTALTFWPST